MLRLSEKRAWFFDEIRDSIGQVLKTTVDKVQGRRSASPGDDEESIALLAKCLDDGKCAHAFERMVYDALEKLSYSFMLTLDQNTPLAGKLRVALLDWDTKENLAPRNDTYADEFLRHMLAEER